MRIGFAGASGTGKSTMAEWLATQLGAPLNPIGSRSVALEMGLVDEKGEPNPYLADARGLRAEFQRALLDKKIGWEREASAFVTDRTTLDNATYSMMHMRDLRGLASYLKSAVEGMRRYDVVFYLPAESFIRIGGDGARVGGRDDGASEEDVRAYHDAYNAILFALLLRHRPDICVVSVEGIEDRKAAVARRLRLDYEPRR